MHQYRQENNPRRQKCISPDHGRQPRPKDSRIETIEKLHEALQEAIGIEHFTIPPYLCALYSIKDGSNAESADIIRSVVVEEMLHMILASNILNAIGGEPKINAKSLLPKYPSPLPHSAIGFEVGLVKFSRQSVNTFLRIERPAESNVPRETGKFRSIGEFYAAVREALIRLDKEAKAKGNKQGIFTGTKTQVPPEYFYNAGGRVTIVEDIDGANRAIDEIVGQGEGIDHTIDDGDPGFEKGVELAHYFRFNQIFNERRYKAGDLSDDSPSGDSLPVAWDAVHNMIPDPKMHKFGNQPKLLEMVKTFNRSYMALLDNLHVACNGKPEVLKEGIPMMHALKHQAIGLMKIPCGIGDFTAGPTFEYVPQMESDEGLLDAGKGKAPIQPKKP